MDAIDSAIMAHRSWVARFKTAFKGNNTEVFDPLRANDAESCELGRWLASGRSSALLGEENWQSIKGIHVKFHETACQIAVLLNQGETFQDTQALIERFDELSKQLVKLLMQGKKNLSRLG